ncbi:peptidyl-prolyl cis-trans isomerase [candidate division KSB1 bacterium]|nr:MAG: peptidyl-prolyl cis-trans isomerase [candidate division KSB1 bacterium]
MAQQNPKVSLKTNKGTIVLELYPEKAPVSVENFLQYVKSGFYDGVIFHRVIKNFMIQGGGFDKDFNRKQTKDPIVNEATNGLKNKRGTIAYARTSVINSATSQFFINHADNYFLDHKGNSPQDFGYAVFGKVIEGMDVVDKIANVKTHIYRGMKDVPLKEVVILKAEIVKPKKNAK